MLKGGDFMAACRETNLRIFYVQRCRLDANAQDQQVQNGAKLSGYAAMNLNFFV
jgi:hypothetical protein